MFCPYCGSEDTSANDKFGVNNSVYIECERCKTKCNVYEDIITTCDNTDCKGDYQDVKPVTMLEEFGGGGANWCSDCRIRDKEIIEDKDKN